MRQGFTLVETVIVLLVVGIVAAIGGREMAGVFDRMAVKRAVSEAWSFYQTARYAALVHGSAVRVHFGPEQMVAAYEMERDSVFLVRPGPTTDGVELTGSRLVTRLHANGLGAGAANLTLTFRRGRYVEKLTLSRLGRIRRLPRT